MTSVRTLKMIHGAGEPDSALAYRIDVVTAAVVLVESWAQGEYEACDKAAARLTRAVRRYKKALRVRGQS